MVPCILAMTWPAQAQTDLHFRAYTQDDGLSNNFVICLEQDQRGFFWIGTENGLNRFDGQRFVEFRHDPEDARGLDGNLITQLLEDSRQNLWVGTHFGLNRLNRATGDFERMPLRGVGDKAGNYRVAAIYEDLAQNLWIACDAYGLLKLGYGRCVLRSAVADDLQALSLEGQAPGTYLVRLQMSTGESQVERVVVVNR